MSHNVRQDNWNGVYYDRQAEEFLVVRVEEEGVTLVDAFTGEDYETLGFPEFEDCDADGDFEEVSEHVVRDPAEFAENLLYDVANAVSGDATHVKRHSPVDVDFAITAVNLSFDDSAPYLDTLDEL